MDTDYTIRSVSVIADKLVCVRWVDTRGHLDHLTVRRNLTDDAGLDVLIRGAIATRYAPPRPL